MDDNRKRWIDATFKLIEYRRTLESLMNPDAEVFDMAVQAMRRQAQEKPAADVVPVRLGEWLDGYKMQTCSLCKCRGKKSWTFCPHCGARMIYGKREE